MDALRMPLINARQAHTCIQRTWEAAKPELIAGRRLVLTLSPATRTGEMNDRLHATISDLSRQLPWAGAMRTKEVWKRLLVAAWLRARGENLEILPAIDGHGVDIIYERTSKLSQRDCGELCEYIYAWGAERGVRFSAPEDAIA